MKVKYTEISYCRLGKRKIKWTHSNQKFFVQLYWRKCTFVIRYRVVG